MKWFWFWLLVLLRVMRYRAPWFDSSGSEMNDQEIRQAFKGGDSPADILRAMVAAGVEYPDAEWRVISALRLDNEAKAEMIANYDDCT